MNDRLLNNPDPAARDRSRTFRRELQEIIYRALEREPQEPLREAHEFAWDLEHQDQVGVADRAGVARLEAASHAVAEEDSVLCRAWR